VDPDLLKVLLPAVVGLIGTLFGLWLGHRRWSAERQTSKRSGFDAKRHRAYVELWDMVESAHITIRTAQPTLPEIRELDKKINAFRMRNEPVLDSADLDLSNRYFNSVVTLSAAVAASGSKEMAERFQTTATIPGSDVEELKDLVEATEKVRAVRQELLDRVRAVLLETSYAADAA
jgi:hypothetical protein